MHISTHFPILTAGLSNAVEQGTYPPAVPVDPLGKGLGKT